MSGERYCSLRDAAKDGFFVRADILGLAYSAFSGDYRVQGYRALSRLQRPLNASQRIAEIAGIGVGLASNVATLGLVNVMLLSEVYCKDSHTHDRKK